MKWVVPQRETIKVNVDATIFEDQGAIGFGMIARDSKVEFVIAGTCLKQSMATPELEEDMVTKEALSWIKRQPWQRVVLEIDC